MDLERTVRAAAGGDLDAFAEIISRFQHMAFGYALSFVRDLGQAEDVVQEAFVAAWYALPSLTDPAAFAGWLRGIVRHRAHRVLRRKHLEALPLSSADTVAADEPAPDRRVERRQQARAVLAAIGDLARPLREVVTLYYVHDCSHQDIATFLGVPVTTVNNRLHAARAQLKRRILTMVKDTLETHQLPDDFAARIGRIVRAREGLVEARFDPLSLPDFLTEIVVSDDARQRAVTLQVVQRLPDGVVRCVATSPADTLEPGMTVMSAGRQVQTPVSQELFDRSVRLLTGPPAPSGAPAELLETGIKVIDVMCPLVRGGTVAIAGELRAGTTVVMEELVRRLSGGSAGVSLFTLAPWTPVSIADTLRQDGFSEGTMGPVQTFRRRPAGGRRAGSGRADARARRKAPALLRAAVLRGRAVHEAPRRHRRPRRVAPGLPRDPRRRPRQRPREGVLFHRRARGGAGERGRALVTSCPDAAETAQSRHRWRGTGSGSISAGPSPTSPSSTRRGASCSV